MLSSMQTTQSVAALQLSDAPVLTHSDGADDNSKRVASRATLCGTDGLGSWLQPRLPQPRSTRPRRFCYAQRMRLQAISTAFLATFAFAPAALACPAMAACGTCSGLA